MSFALRLKQKRMRSALLMVDRIGWIFGMEVDGRGEICRLG